MGELEQEYGKVADFVVVPAQETMERQDEIDRFGFTDLKHGLVVFGPDGEAAVLMPGHQFGREEIERALTSVLREG